MTSANSRIDEALSRLEAVDNASTGTIAGLASRMGTAESDIDTLESTVNDATTGLAATKAIADAAATNSDLTALTTRVSTLENTTKSATTIVSYDKITYNSSTGIPTIYTSNLKDTVDTTVTQDVDYLL